MNTGFLITALAAASALTSLTVEGIKKLLDEQGKAYKPNLLAAIVAILLSIFTIAGYALYMAIPISVQLVVITIAFAFLSWLTAMVGFDKVKQLIQQFTSSKED